MAIRATYTDNSNTNIYVTLDVGDTLGGIYGPAAFSVTVPSRGNNEYDELMKLVAAGTIVIAPFALAPTNLAEYASAAHARARDGGVTIAGIRVKTDSESRALIDGAYSLSMSKPDIQIDFKAASGWIVLNASLMQTLAVAVGSWVQSCYSAWKAVSEKIASGEYTTPAQIDAAFAAIPPPA